MTMRVLHVSGEPRIDTAAFTLQEFRPVSVGIITHTFRQAGRETIYVRFQAALVTSENRVIEIGRQTTSRTDAEDNLAAALSHYECDHD